MDTLLQTMASSMFSILLASLDTAIGAITTGTERLPDNHMTIRYLLNGTEQGTLLILEHSNLLTEEHRNMMIGVWDFLLTQLKFYVEQT